MKFEHLLDKVNGGRFEPNSVGPTEKCERSRLTYAWYLYHMIQLLIPDNFASRTTAVNQTVCFKLILSSKSVRLGNAFKC